MWADLSQVGVLPAIAFTGEVLTNVKGGSRREMLYACRLEASVEWDLEALTSVPGRFHASGFGIHGESLSEGNLDDVHVVSNIDADDSVRLFELWYEQEFWGGRASLRAGKLAADQELVVSRELSSFINGTFGMPTLITVNTPAPVYPLAAPGIRARFDLDKVALQAAVYEGSPVDPESDEAGTHFRLGGKATAFVEVSLEDRCKVGMFAHTEGARGAYAIFESSVSPSVAFAFRVGVSPGGLLSFYADFGITCKALIPGRDEDVLGVAVAHSEFDAEESVVEWTYLAVLAPWLSVQSDAQYIFLAGDDALVLGFRFVLTF